MKKLIFAFALLFSTYCASSQIEFGIKAGLNSIDLVSNSIKINNGIDFKEIRFRESKYGHHFGVYTRLNILGIYIEPGAIFNSNSVTYSLDDYSSDQPVSTLVNESYSNLDIPLMVGLKAGIVRLYGGPVAHVHINSKSDLFDWDSYAHKFKSSSYGYQAGIGLDLWKLRFDLAYEGNLGKFGNHINVDGESYAFDNSASRIIATIGMKF